MIRSSFCSLWTLVSSQQPSWGSPWLTGELSDADTWSEQAGCGIPHLHAPAHTSPPLKPPRFPLDPAFLRSITLLHQFACWKTESRMHMRLCLLPHLLQTVRSTQFKALFCDYFSSNLIAHQTAHQSNITLYKGISNPGGSWNALMTNSSSKGQRSPWAEVLCWTLFSPTRRGWWGMWSSRAALVAVAMKLWSSRSLGQRGGCTASSLPWTSGVLALASSGICLVEYDGIKPWREEGPKKSD